MPRLRRRRRAQHAQRRRRDEGVAHAHPRHQRVGLSGVELLDLLRHHRHAVVQGRQQHVEQTAGPGPVRRRPEPVARLRQEFVRKLDAGKMTDQHAMGVQGAFRRTGRARGIDHQRGVVGPGGDRGEFAAARASTAWKSSAPSAAPSTDSTSSRSGSGGAGARELFQSLGVGDQRPGAGILQAIGDRLVPEQDRQRQRDRAELVDGDVARGHRRSLRQQDRDPIATPDAMGRERIGEPVRALAQRAVADLLHRAVCAHVEDGDAAGFAARPSGRIRRHRYCSAPAPASGTHGRARRSRSRRAGREGHTSRRRLVRRARKVQRWVGASAALAQRVKHHADAHPRPRTVSSEVAQRACGPNDRNFKSTALAPRESDLALAAVRRRRPRPGRALRVSPPPSPFSIRPPAGCAPDRFQASDAAGRTSSRERRPIARPLLKIPRYFFSSSVCVYRDMKQDEPEMTEEEAMPAIPANEYGWEKLY